MKRPVLDIRLVVVNEEEFTLKRFYTVKSLGKWLLDSDERPIKHLLITGLSPKPVPAETVREVIRECYEQKCPLTFTLLKYEIQEKLEEQNDNPQ